jgi:hypothetical protein
MKENPSICPLWEGVGVNSSEGIAKTVFLDF